MIAKQPPLTYERLLSLARAAEGTTLETATGKQFTVGIWATTRR